MVIKILAFIVAAIAAVAAFWLGQDADSLVLLLAIAVGGGLFGALIGWVPVWGFMESLSSDSKERIGYEYTDADGLLVVMVAVIVFAIIAAVFAPLGYFL